jgi:glycosyl transferase family 2
MALIAAALIVRDEAELLPACLESLAGVVDEIHVHDTGSTDDTPHLARRHGAIVTHGNWSDDFAAARNAAAAGWRADWVLAVDADHRATAAPGELRDVLRAAGPDVLRVEVDDAHHADPYRQFETRLYRPAAARWAGRVHERLVRPDGTAPPRGTVPPGVLRLRHLGHATHADRIRRAERNLALARRTVDELAAVGPAADRPGLAAALLALGRDCAAAERWQRAVDTFETLRELFPGTPEWTQATDALSRVVLAAGYDKVCLVLVEQLREAGASPSYCDYLAAQAMAQLGHPHEASALLAGVTEIVDTAGRRRDESALRELTTLVHRLSVLAPGLGPLPPAGHIHPG